MNHSSDNIMDDFLILGYNKKELFEMKEKIKVFSIHSKLAFLRQIWKFLEIAGKFKMVMGILNRHG